MRNVLDGAVCRGCSTVRVTVQLTDATSYRHGRAEDWAIEMEGLRLAAER